MTKLTIDLHAILTNQLSKSIVFPTTIETDELLVFCDINMHEIDVHSLLAEQGKIAILWDITDVRSMRPDLTDHQAWQVLECVEDHHDANRGVAWDDLDCVAAQMFPEPEQIVEAHARQLESTLQSLLDQSDESPTESRGGNADSDMQ